MKELIVDNFAGGGGASKGIEMALGRSPDIAINHDAAAIAMHKANHPGTEHYTEDVWKVSPWQVTKGSPVGLLWLSPDCKHFSRAKGSKPVEKKIRSLAWVAHRWVAEPSLASGFLRTSASVRTGAPWSRAGSVQNVTGEERKDRPVWFVPAALARAVIAEHWK